MEVLLIFLYGGLTVLCFVAGVIFIGYARSQRDRFFRWFAVAFWCLGASWGIHVFDDLPAEEEPVGYLLRLVGFVLIILAILDKNRRR
jgi:hypothetical protein